MALEVEWTDTADEQLDRIIDYLEAKWTDKEIVRFFEQLEKGIETISTHPKRQKKSLRKLQTREYQISPHATIFYTYDTGKVTLLLLWSNRMDPDRL